jgi:peptidoglycan/xylan/chitin deacetylase (PgdA/CDA1 family)
MAITFDDLPAHGALPPGGTRVAVASKITAALRDAQAPPIFGFVNGLPIEQQPADAVVFEAWRAAGFPLGNHTWSHMNLNEHSPAEFEADSSRNEPLLREWMQGEDWHWFRFPSLPKAIHQKRKAPLGTFSCNAATRSERSP